MKRVWPLLVMAWGVCSLAVYLLLGWWDRRVCSAVRTIGR